MGVRGALVRLMRRKNPPVAFVLNAMPWGLGYVYVGRRRLLGFCLYIFLMAAFCGAFALIGTSSNVNVYDNENRLAGSFAYAGENVELYGKDNHFIGSLALQNPGGLDYPMVGFGLGWVLVSLALGRDAYIEAKRRNAELEKPGVKGVP